jgi:hypothetical protein
MKARNILLPLAGLAGALLLPLAAQAQVPFHHPAGINQRLRDQNARIRQGDRTGQMTRPENWAARAQDNRVRRQEEQDRFSHGGRLTYGERAHLNRELNHNNGRIYRLKHNDRNR